MHRRGRPANKVLRLVLSNDGYGVEARMLKPQPRTPAVESKECSFQSQVASEANIRDQAGCHGWGTSAVCDGADTP